MKGHLEGEENKGAEKEDVQNVFAFWNSPLGFCS